MPSRRDQLHSYQFMLQRVISSLMVRETDPEQTPLRRGVGAAFGGVMIAVLVAAVFGVVGVLTGVGGDGWRQDGSIIIERETGTRYVYLDGTLHPVLNYASARLIGGRADAEPHRVSGDSLAGIPRAATVGIPGAPDSLPGADRLADASWTMCSAPEQDDAGAPVTVTTLLVGGEVAEGSPFGDRGLLVHDEADGTRYLLWRNHRYRFTGDSPDGVIRSLFGAQHAIADVGSAWLNGLPSGQDIGPIAIPGAGRPATAASGYTVGDIVFHPVGNGTQHYLVLDGGLAPLTEFQLRIVLGQSPVRPVEIPASVANGLPTSDALAPVRGDPAAPAEPPELMPLPANGRTTLCARTTDASTPPLVSMGGDLTWTEDAALATPVESGTGVKFADRVLVPPGEVAVVRAMSSDRADTGALNLVTDTGWRFPVPSDEVLGVLGYDPADAVPMPAALVQRIPAGATLTPADALRPAAIAG